ncbi:hypothetical protein ACLMJK_009098 [Lecanora helva]
MTRQHNVIPEKSLISEITHVALAFMRPAVFNEAEPSSFPLFTTVERVRLQFPPEAVIMVAVGGWGDTEGFEVAAATEESRKLFAANVKRMIDVTGADGVDIDWEYPGGNGEDYKKVPNSEKSWQIQAYPLLLSEIRSAIGKDKIMSAAVPGLPRDMIAFTADTIPAIDSSLDFFNVMTYDLMNRRDNVTKHHTSIEASMTAMYAYEERGVETEKMNLGFAFYIKWFKTDSKEQCRENPVSCRTALMEDPVTGADLGRAGAFSWHDPVPEELAPSYKRAMANGKYDNELGGYYYWDEEEELWWSWDPPDVIAKKFPAIIDKKNLGGAFAWGLGEDADDFVHLRALNAAVRPRKDESSRAQFFNLNIDVSGLAKLSEPRSKEEL